MFSLVRQNRIKSGTKTIFTKLCWKPLPVRQRHILSPQNGYMASPPSLRLPSFTRTLLTKVSNECPTVEEHESFLTLESKTLKLELPYIWLRDHCRCDACYNYSTNQKNILAQELDLDIRPTEVSYTDDRLMLKWPDDHVTSYSLPWLQINAYPGPDKEKVVKHLWDATDLSLDDIPRVDLQYLLQEEDGLKELLRSLLKYGIGLVSGVPATDPGTQQAAERVSFMQRTTYGDLWNFTADGSRGDTAYTNIALGGHNDCTYFSVPVGIQVFHCLYHDGEGGETLLVDGFKAAEKVRAADPDAFETLTTTRLNHENADSLVHLRSLDPIIKVHPVTGQLEVIRYNQYDRAPMSTVPPARMRSVYHALAVLGRTLQRPEAEMWLKLRPGTVLFIDNWRVLHGRAAFTGKRQLNGCYLPRDDWISNARKLGLVHA